jgi:magnesium-transporting ATPase (P-type)
MDKLEQNEVETDLHLLGLLIFRNQLKPETPDAIRQLKQGEVGLFNHIYISL